jgi:signal transduction histidine kinase
MTRGDRRRDSRIATSPVRFDDSLSTVLSADASTGFGAAATWRQLVDLIGRGRAAPDEPALARLRLLRQAVPSSVRAASARALAFAEPDAALVGLFAEDDLAISAPILRTAQIDPADWIALLPRLSPAQRSVLRHRRDLAAEVVRALASFGSVDFVLEGTPAVPTGENDDDRPVPPDRSPIFIAETVGADPEVAVSSDAVERDQPAPTPPSDTPLSETPFVALGQVAFGLPVVAEALRRTDVPPPPLPTPGRSGYAISDLVARIEAFTKRRDEIGGEPEPGFAAPAPSEKFSFRADETGLVRWVEGIPRAALIGLSLAHGGPQGLARVDGGVTGAFRRRSRFTDARLALDGGGSAAGAWRVSGMPMFDPDTGRFTGYHGQGRRPRSDEMAEPQRRAGAAGAESLRQLVHELRTPTNAIAGFAELIESQLLGPVSPTYRTRAGAIRAHAADLVAAIEDLDTAARIDGDALELRAATIDLARLVDRVLADLVPLAELRGVETWVAAESDLPLVAADDRALERLVGRLLSTVLSAGAAGERLECSLGSVAGMVTLAMDRPRALLLEEESVDAALLAIDQHDGEGAAGAPLLGVGFALRLARNLAAELGGELVIDQDRLTLRLPAALNLDMGQATNL